MNNKTYIEIGQMVRVARQAQGLTQMDLAEKLGYDSPQFVSLFERALSKLPHETIGKLSKILPKLPLAKIRALLREDFIERMDNEIKLGMRGS